VLLLLLFKASKQAGIAAYSTTRMKHASSDILLQEINKENQQDNYIMTQANYVKV